MADIKRMELPVDLSSRVAELEATVAALGRLLSGTRRRDAEATTPRPVRLVRTAERAATGGDHGYVATDDVALPITFLDLTYSAGDLTRSTRSAYPQTVVRSQFGWLPPGVEMMVAPGLDDRYLFACRPPLLHGVLSTGDSAATWDGDCEGVAFAAIQVQIWRLNTSNGKYEPAEYSNGDPVLMDWLNAGDALPSGNVMLTAAINADNQWIATPENCEAACSGG